jgi:tRNA 2-thiouridine synthesizing protein C
MNEAAPLAQKLLFVFTTAPYSNACGQEGLDALLSAANLEQEVSALFLHDGVFQIKRHQDTSHSVLKQVTKTFQALDDFGVEQVYVYEASMVARGLNCEDLVIDAQVLGAGAIGALISCQFRVFTF